MNRSNNVLVTGGAGYIGSHTCKSLASGGYSPVTVDNLSRGHRWACKWGPLEVGGIEDREFLTRVILRYHPVAVIHFAAFAYVGESYEDPAKYYRNNVAGTLTLLEAMRDQGVDKIVFSSTCNVYGEPETNPINETQALQPINPYGRSKLIIENMLADFDEAYGMRSARLRYFNAAGADSDGEIGELHTPETHLIPLVLETAMKQRSHLDVYGDDYDTPDGTCIRDYIHVSDLAAAHVLALRHMESGGPSIACNLGNGNGFSVKEVVETAEAVTGRKIPTHVTARRPGDAPRLVADATRARRELEWNPAFSDLHTIIDSAWKWFQVQSKRTKSV